MYSKSLVKTTAITSAFIFMAALSACGNQTIDDDEITTQSAIEATSEVEVAESLDTEVQEAVNEVTKEEPKEEATVDTSVDVTQFEDKSLENEDSQTVDYLVMDESQAVVEETVSKDTEEVKAEPVVYMPEVKQLEQSVTKYTNKDCNVRQFDSKDSQLITTLSQNTAVTVTGTTKSGWSQVNIDGVNCYIKSSFLSDAKAETPKQSASTPPSTEQASSSQPANDVTVQQPTQAEAQSAAELQKQVESVLGGLGPSMDEMPVCGHTGGTGIGDWSGVTFE